MRCYRTYIYNFNIYIDIFLSSTGDILWKNGYFWVNFKQNFQVSNNDTG